MINNLEEKENSDRTKLAVAKAIVAAVPSIFFPDNPLLGLGMPGLVEFVSSFLTQNISVRRIGRLEKLITFFVADVAHVEPAYIEARLNDPAFFDLFEEGSYAVMESLSDERIRRISILLSNNIHSDADLDIARISLGFVRKWTDLELAYFCVYHRKSTCEDRGVRLAEGVDIWLEVLNATVKNYANMNKEEKERYNFICSTVQSDLERSNMFFYHGRLVYDCISNQIYP